MANISADVFVNGPHPAAEYIGVRHAHMQPQEEWKCRRPRTRTACPSTSCCVTGLRLPFDPPARGMCPSCRVLREALTNQPLLPFLQYGLSRYRKRGAFDTEGGRRSRARWRGRQSGRCVGGLLPGSHRSHARGSRIRNSRSTPWARHRNPGCSNGLPISHVLQAFAFSRHTCCPGITR